MSYSNSNSSSLSNLLTFSSQSSNLTANSKKTSQYSEFIVKVNSLFDQQHPDLDQLYSKIEKLTKYHHDEVIFRNVLKHVATLKGNHKKIKRIALLLEKNIDNKDKHIENREKGHRNKNHQYLDERTTMSTQKNDPTKQRIGLENNVERELGNNVSSQMSVNNSLKYKHVHKPSFKKKQNYQFHDKNALSPTSSNRSIEEYHQRNMYYEERISSMLKDLKSIKHQIHSSSHLQPSHQDNVETSQNHLQPEHQGHFTQIQEENSSFHLNPPFHSQRFSQETIIGLVDQQHFQNTHHFHQENLKKEQIKEYSQSNQSNQKLSSYFQNSSGSSSQKNLHKKQILLNYTKNVAKEIQQLKSAASKLQIIEQKSGESSLSVIAEASISETKINQLIRKDSEEKAKRPILQQISNASSKIQISNQTIDEKIINQQTKQVEKLHNPSQLNAKRLTIQKQEEIAFATSSLQKNNAISQSYLNKPNLISNQNIVNSSLHPNFSYRAHNLSRNHPNNILVNSQPTHQQRSISYDNAFKKEVQPFVPFGQMKQLHPSNLLISQEAPIFQRNLESPIFQRNHSVSNSNRSDLNKIAYGIGNQSSTSIMKNQLIPSKFSRQEPMVVQPFHQLNQSNLSSTQIKKTGITLQNKPHFKALEINKQPQNSYSLVQPFYQRHNAMGEQNIVFNHSKIMFNNSANQEIKKKGINLLSASKDQSQ